MSSLALVIPVRDDQPGLDRLLRQAGALAIFDQIVISDDGSLIPANAETAGCDPSRIVLRRSECPGGAGAARNRVLEDVRTSHFLYFDSDDLLTAEFPDLWSDVSDEAFDFCLFRHHDSRVGRHSRWGQMPLDNALWRAAGAGASALFQPGREALAALAKTANYPWNKIYRTEFLRENGLRCSETPVHNDIALHWFSFLRAKRVLASDRVSARHDVHHAGRRLTNLSGAERLCVFEPLSDVAEALATSARPRLQVAFFDFVAGLLDWIRTVLAPEHHERLDRETAGFLRCYLTPDLFESLCQSEPLLAMRLVLQAAGGKAPC